MNWPESNRIFGRILFENCTEGVYAKLNKYGLISTKSQNEMKSLITKVSQNDVELSN